LRVDWIKSKIQTGVKCFPEATVVLLDRAAAIARADGVETVGNPFTGCRPVVEAKGRHRRCANGMDRRRHWRPPATPIPSQSASQSGSAEYLSPERAAELGIHQQTIRGYPIRQTARFAHRG
jgi:hypothetical protein